MHDPLGRILGDAAWKSLHGEEIMVTTLPEQTESQAAIDAPSRGVFTAQGAGNSEMGRTLLVIGLVCSGLGLLGWAGWALAFDGPSTNEALILYTVKQSDLPIQVTENGSLQSQKTTELPHILTRSPAGLPPNDRSRREGLVECIGWHLTFRAMKSDPEITQLQVPVLHQKHVHGGNVSMHSAVLVEDGQGCNDAPPLATNASLRPVA